MHEMLTVGQVARSSGLTPKALRHYDRIGLLRPAVVDEASGRRRYDPAQLEPARLVARLRAVDLPLEQVRECLAASAASASGAAADTIGRLLAEHRKRMTARLTRTQTALHRLDHLIADGLPETNVGDSMTTDQETPTINDERALAVELFNGVWRLLEKEDRSAADDERMVHMAHASRYHWGQVGTPSNLSIGEWQCSRVYAVVGRAEPALHHAAEALRITQENGIGDFQLAFAYEALARAHAVAGDAEEARRWTEQALAATESVSQEDDRELLRSDLETIPGQDRFW
jgi:DNA-binding transcriptional MerR regulator